MVNLRDQRFAVTMRGKGFELMERMRDEAGMTKSEFLAHLVISEAQRRNLIWLAKEEEYYGVR